MEKTKKYSLRVGLILSLAWLLIASFVFLTSAATSGNGQTTNKEFTWSWSTDNSGDNAAGNFTGSLSNKILTLQISATSSTFKSGSCGGSSTPATATYTNATIKNNTGETIRIDQITNNGCSIDIAVGKVLANGETFKLSIAAHPNSTEDTKSQTSTGSVLITYTVIENVAVTFYGATDVSYVFNNETLSSESSSTKVLMAVESSLTLPNTPIVSSGTFYGWRLSHDGSLRPAGSNVTVTADTSVYPVVVADNLIAPFTVNGTSYYFWTDAAYAADTGNVKTIVLNQMYTLPTTMVANGVSPDGSKYLGGSDGNLQYIVPSNVIFQIPYDDSNTLCTTAPTIDGTTGTLSATSNSWVKPTVYRKLTMPSGTNFSVNGAISLSGRQCSIQGSNGMPTKATSFIEMAVDSSITVNGGASLYVWGYITGNGKVLIKSGGTAYECFQMRDWRGGTAVSSMLGEKETKKVFPASQYYVQNVEVEMTMETGALEYAYTCLVASKCFADALVPFVGPAGMFRLYDGVIVKDYIESEDRLRVDIAGDLAMSALVINAQGPMGINYDMNSANFVLPIVNNLLVTAKSGTTTISQELAFLPGSELVVEEGAIVKVASGVNVYVYDLDEWVGEGYVFSNLDASPLKFVGFKAGLSTVTPNDRPTMEDAKIVVKGTFDVGQGYLYTTSGGANIIGSGKGTIIVGSNGTVTETYQYDQNASVYDTITVVPAQFKNAVDTFGPYVFSAKHGTNTYIVKDGVWHIQGCTGITETNTATCTEAGEHTVACSCYDVQAPCECHYKAGEVPAMGHEMGEWDHSNVISVQTCTRDCGEEHYHLFVYQDKDATQAGVDFFYQENGLFWMDASCYLGSYENFDVSKLSVTVDNGSEVSFYVMNNNQILIAVKVLSDDLTAGSMKLTVTYDGIASDPIEVGFLAYYDAVFETSKNQAYLEALKAYGDAADLYFNGTEEEKNAVVAPEKPAEVDSALKGDFNKQSNVDGMTMSTTGANIYFDDALRLSVQYSMAGTLPEGWTLVQLGLLVGENWDGQTMLTTSKFDAAYLIYQGEGDVSSNGEIVFDMAASQYLSEFSIRTFAVAKDTEGNTHCIYGHQYRYGLETYINRVYDKSDNAYKNLLVKTWIYAEAAAKIQPPQTGSEVTK